MDSTKKTLSAILKKHGEEIANIGKVKEDTAMGFISRAKAKGETPKMMLEEAEKTAGNDLHRLLVQVCALCMLLLAKIDVQDARDRS